MLRAAALFLALACAACAERPIIGIEIGTPRVEDCIPGSVTKPCRH